MSIRGFLIVLVISVAAVALAIGERMMGADYAAAARTGAPAAAGLSRMLNDIDRVVVETAERTLTFTRDDGVWRLAERNGYPLRSGAMQKALFMLSELKLADAKTRRADRYGRIGVAEPASGEDSAGRRIAAIAGGETIANVIVGNTADPAAGVIGGGVYLRRSGEEQAWLASGPLDVSGEIKDWIDRRVSDVAEGTVERVTLIQPDGEVVVVARNESGEYDLLDIPEGYKLTSAFRKNVIARFLTELDVDDVSPLANVEVDWRAARRAIYEIDGGLTVTLTLAGDEPSGYWLRIDAAGTEEADALDGRHADWAYLVPDWKAGDLLRGMNELVEPENAEAGAGG